MKRFFLLFIVLVLISVGVLGFLVYRARSSDFEFGFTQRKTSFKK